MLYWTTRHYLWSCVAVPSLFSEQFGVEHSHASASERENMNNLDERIRRHAFFRDMKSEHLAILIHHAQEMRFETGEVLFLEGEPANKFYLIESGSVALEAHEPADGTMLVQNLEAGEVLGWSWLFPPFVWHFQARALEPTRAIVLDGGHLLTTAERDHEF